MILDMIKQLSEDYSRQIAFTFLSNGQNQELTFGDIYNKSSVLANILLENGLQSGERILILTDQSAENVIAIVGAMLARGVFVMIPPPTDEGKRKRLTSVIESCDPKFCLVSHELRMRLGEEELKEMLGEHVELLDVPGETDESVSVDLQLERQEDELVYIQYTSGSTSEPKGIMVDYRTLMSALYDSGKSIPTEKARTGVSWIPFYHNIGLLCIIFRTFYNQTHFYIMKPEDFLQNPLSWFVNCAKYKVQFTAGPNSAYSLCAHYMTEELAKQLDLSNLQYIINGSEPIHEETQEEFVAAFKETGITLKNMCPAYGLAEVVCGVTTGSAGTKITAIDLAEYKKNRFVPAIPGRKFKTMVSQGECFSNTQVVIVNPKTLMRCKPDELGEIWITGTSVTRGYWGVAEEDDNTFHQHLEGDNKEYLRTGDCGVLYEGELYVTGRMKEVLIINGHNIYPSDIENDLSQQFPRLAGCTFVIFQTNVRGKERMVFCLEGKFEEETCKELTRQIQNAVQIAYDTSPYDVVFCNPYSFPRTDNGKVKKTLVKEYYKNKVLQSYHSIKGQTCSLEQEMELDEVEKKIKKIIEELLQTTIRSKEDDFLDLGGNSFDSVELAQTLNKEFSVELAMSEVLNHTHFHELVMLIKHRMKHDNISAAEKNLYQDCVLPDDIEILSTYKKELNECKTVFVTGTTGFLGAYLLKALLDSSDMKIFCHVRAEDETAGKKRIQDNMEKYGLWKDSYVKRLHAVPGDLRKPELGMTEKWYDRISEETDIILHNGAMLNFLYPYSYLKDTNVKGTIECIRLACRHHAKYVGYVSTFSVYDNPSHFNQHVMEDDSLDNSDGYLLPYSETKWVSEKLIELARKKGLRTIVFRPGEITGSSSTGKWDFGDMISRTIVSCLLLGEMPTQVSNLYMTPVDYVADAAVHIIQQPGAWNHAYNLVNLNILHGNELGQIAAKIGYPVKLVSYEKWKSHLFRDDMKKSPLKIMESLFLEDESKDTSIIRRYSVVEPIFDTTNADRLLRNSGISCPPVTEELILKYIRNFIEQGVLE